MAVGGGVRVRSVENRNGQAQKHCQRHSRTQQPERNADSTSRASMSRHFLFLFCFRFLSQRGGERDGNGDG